VRLSFGGLFTIAVAHTEQYKKIQYQNKEIIFLHFKFHKDTLWLLLLKKDKNIRHPKTIIPD